MNRHTTDVSEDVIILSYSAAYWPQKIISFAQFPGDSLEHSDEFGLERIPVSVTWFRRLITRNKDGGGSSTADRQPVDMEK